MKTGSLLLLLAVACHGGAAVAGTMYRWQDEAGRLYLTDTPPPPNARLLSKTVVAPAPARSEPSPAPGPQARPDAAPVLDVVMYATARCPYCRRARQYFTARGIPWREIDIESSAGAEREFQSLGGAGVPLIFVNGTRIAGFDAGRLDAVISRARRGVAP